MRSPEMKSRVLIVDDEEDVRESMRDVIEMAGCEAILVASAAAALEVMSESRPCLVILDLFMPEMSGTQMLELLRQKPELASVPVVICTSAPERAPRDVPVLKKPIRILELAGHIRANCRCAVE